MAHRRPPVARAESEAARPVSGLRCFAIAGLDQKQVAADLGYADHSVISKWIAGTENPQIAKLLKVPGFRGAFMVALAECGDSGVEVKTVVTVARRRLA